MQHNHVLHSFQLSDSCYEPEILVIRDETIARYGEEEWKKVVMTNDIHGHLGIYSTIGAKMGLWAKEQLAADEHEDIRVESFAGTVPPISCLNDGLQISTGATIGHGLISISDEPQKRVEAVFSAGERSIRVMLKDEYQQQIIADIEKGTRLYGRTAPYWEYVRRLALRYWKEWNRNELFIRMD